MPSGTDGSPQSRRSEVATRIMSPASVPAGIGSVTDADDDDAELAPTTVTEPEAAASWLPATVGTATMPARLPMTRATRPLVSRGRRVNRVRLRMGVLPFRGRVPRL